jgi:hypothetical protein
VEGEAEGSGTSGGAGSSTAVTAPRFGGSKTADTVVVRPGARASRAGAPDQVSTPRPVAAPAASAARQGSSSRRVAVPRFSSTTGRSARLPRATGPRSSAAGRNTGRATPPEPVTGTSTGAPLPRPSTRSAARCARSASGQYSISSAKPAPGASRSGGVPTCVNATSCTDQSASRPTRVSGPALVQRSGRRAQSRPGEEASSVGPKSRAAHSSQDARRSTVIGSTASVQRGQARPRHS